MTGKSNTMSTLRSESCHSSYDNLDFASDYDDFGEYKIPYLIKEVIIACVI